MSYRLQVMIDDAWRVACGIVASGKEAKPMFIGETVGSAAVVPLLWSNAEEKRVALLGLAAMIDAVGLQRYVVVFESWITVKTIERNAAETIRAVLAHGAGETAERFEALTLIGVEKTPRRTIGVCGRIAGAGQYRRVIDRQTLPHISGEFTELFGADGAGPRN